MTRGTILLVVFFFDGCGITRLTVPEGQVPAGIVTSRARAPSPDSVVAGEVLSFVNAYRAAGATCGRRRFPPVAPLSLDRALIQAADAHALDMATNDFFSHTGSDGSRPFDRMARAGFFGSLEGENIAAGYASVSAVVDAWMSSEGHCRNIMNGAFAFTGAALRYDAGSAYGNYWVQTFGGDYK